MKIRPLTQNKLFRPALGASLVVFCGLAFWGNPLGEKWVNASYDYLFRFGARGVTNQLTLVLMDNDAHDKLSQPRERPWDRATHAKLLDKLTRDGCSLVIFDAHLRDPGDPFEDESLADAIRRHGNVILMGDQSDTTLPGVHDVRPVPPAPAFLSAANEHWGIPGLAPELDLIVRKHWPFPGPIESAQFLGLPWAAALQAGAQMSDVPQERWLRYYGPNGSWTNWGYRLALELPANYFRHKIVFVGNKPKTSAPDGEEDEFCTPYTRWTGNAVGGVEIMATSFLNLVNGEWLRRPASWLEVLVLLVSGVLLGGGLFRARPLLACSIAAAVSGTVTFGAVSLSHFTNFWFPWMVIAGGQVPCALAYALLVRPRAPESREGTATKVISEDVPDTPDYELIQPAFGKGAYGKVWLARNAIGQWQALKAVYEANFRESTEPYEREFRGIRRYKPVSDKHPGLLRVDFVSRKKPQGYFYYVMELGDADASGWEENPAAYKPRDLVSIRAEKSSHRLPVADCLRIGIELADALDFLHCQGLIHRDIKPSNIVLVNGHPKLADVGLVTETPQPGKESSGVGTPGYMPPWPEPPGTVQADIFALGMVLYVISTGREPAYFPELSATLIESASQVDFIRLNAIIIKACQPVLSLRFLTAAELRIALRETLAALQNNHPP